MNNEIPENPMYEQAFKRMRRFQSIRRVLRRLGCGILLIFWVAVLLTPCLLVNLMVQREIIIPRSALPEHEYRLFLLQTVDERGFVLSVGGVHSGGADEGEVCLVTNLRYLLWEGEGENLSYCNCYEKMGEDWQLVVAGADKNCQSSD